jgi:hypothetical protein
LAEKAEVFGPTGEPMAAGGERLALRARVKSREAVDRRHWEEKE